MSDTWTVLPKQQPSADRPGRFPKWEEIMKEGKEVSCPFSVILAKAIILAEVRNLPGLRFAELLHYTYQADSIEPANEVCCPTPAALGLPEFNEHCRVRFVRLQGMVADPLMAKVYHLSAYCGLVSSTPGKYTWKPFVTSLSLTDPSGQDDIRQDVRFYLRQWYDAKLVDDNAGNPCEVLRSLQACLRPDVSTESEAQI